MLNYNAPIKTYMELLDLFGYQHEVYDRESVEAILNGINKFCQDDYWPANKIGDQEGLKYDPSNHTVKMPESSHHIYKKLKETGAMALAMPESYGGGEAPLAVTCLINEMLSSANNAFTMGPGLTEAAIHALMVYGSESLKKDYIEKLVSGEWFGTMCLTESHCGTDLGLIKTKATPYEDHYQISGTKIWISFGEHDLTSNIVHLVLAKLPDAPEGSKGISLFLVPKFKLDGSRNKVFCGGLEEKMGIHVCPTCVMNFEQAEGWLIGEPHKGLAAMFVMMNAARIGVGIQGLALSEMAYQTALLFAKDRRQSRSLDKNKRELDEPADTILVHPDVRRMLLECKATNEAMRALVVYSAIEKDRHGDSDRFALLTPVIKSYLTERGCHNISLAQQVLGGSGYVKDWHIEQFYRDARIAMIYEGTNGIQALDLVGRKLPKDQGKAFMALMAEIQSEENNFLNEFKEASANVRGKLQEASMWLMTHASKDPEQAGAVCTRFLNLFALCMLTYMWGLMTKHDKSKVPTGKYFIEHILPESETLLLQIKAGKDSIMSLDNKDF
ncbi:MAG: acyl-CoA dehydrogenase [Pseudomonadota bacterium]|nr:acyl-CoA dehydrogenase [Pseudomonadota bacterium]